MFNKEQIKLVNDVDIWSQENNKYLDKQFQALYKGEDGWSGVAKNYPANFARALALAIEYQHNLQK